MQQSYFLCQVIKSHNLYSSHQPTSKCWLVEMLSRCNKTCNFHRHFVSISLRRGGSVENIAHSHPCVRRVIQTQTNLSTHRDVHLRCLFSWHSLGLALKDLTWRPSHTLETGSCCPVSSPCEIRLAACSLAQCVCGERWQLGIITHLVTRHSRECGKSQTCLLTDSLLFTT